MKNFPFALSMLLLPTIAFAHDFSLVREDAFELFTTLESAGVATSSISEVRLLEASDLLCIEMDACLITSNAGNGLQPSRIDIRGPSVRQIWNLLLKAGLRPSTSGVADGTAGRQFIQVDQLSCTTGPFNGFPSCDLSVKSR